LGDLQAVHQLKEKNIPVLAKLFANTLGDISYQLACHLRVQNIGIKTRDILYLVAVTNVNSIEGCGGLDGTFAV
jgi:hypothetical protein